MNKLLIIGIAAIIVILGVAMGTLYMLGYIRPPSSPAQLFIEKGIVEIKSGDSWIPARNKMELRQDDSVRTLNGSQARIIFFGSSVLRLDENTMVSLADLNIKNKAINISQDSGTTWNKVLKLSGISDYEVQTPTAIATVRGTAFSVRVIGEESEIALVNGTLEVESYTEEKIVEEGKETETIKTIEETRLKPRQKIRIAKGARALTRAVRAMELKELEEDRWISENVEDDREFIEEKAEELRERYTVMIDTIKERRNLTEEQVMEYVEGYIEGRYTVREAIKRGLIAEKDLAILPEELKIEEGVGYETESIAEETAAAESETLATEKTGSEATTSISIEPLTDLTKTDSETNMSNIENKTAISSGTTTTSSTSGSTTDSTTTTSTASYSSTSSDTTVSDSSISSPTKTTASDTTKPTTTTSVY